MQLDANVRLTASSIGCRITLDGGRLDGPVMSAEIVAKRLELLHELAPKAARFVVLVNPNSALSDTVVKDLQRAAPALGLQVEILYAGTDREIDAAFATLAEKRRRTHGKSR
jgi:putative ABC transport system substrate-binding protein